MPDSTNPVAQNQKDRTDQKNQTAPPQEETSASAGGELCPEDFYYEGPYMVFTAAYHLKRGYCCNSDCRHCPYK